MRDPLLSAFGMRVRAIRLGKGLSQEGLAHACGLDRTYVGGIERGERNPSLLNIGRIARALGVELTVLFKLDSAKGRDKPAKKRPQVR